MNLASRTEHHCAHARAHLHTNMVVIILINKATSYIR